jgi:hypothetical protein
MQITYSISRGDATKPFDEEPLNCAMPTNFVVGVEALCLEHLCRELIRGQTLTGRNAINVVGRNTETPFYAERGQERTKVLFERRFSE